MAARIARGPPSSAACLVDLLRPRHPSTSTDVSPALSTFTLSPPPWFIFPPLNTTSSLRGEEAPRFVVVFVVVLVVVPSAAMTCPNPSSVIDAPASPSASNATQRASIAANAESVTPFACAAADPGG